eukprot:scaffold7052_cov254-Pinguiococcus_pyrenoidosus.AAC.69
MPSVAESCVLLVGVCVVLSPLEGPRRVRNERGSAVALPSYRDPRRVAPTDVEDASSGYVAKEAGGWPRLLRRRCARLDVQMEAYEQACLRRGTRFRLQVFHLLHVQALVARQAVRVRDGVVCPFLYQVLAEIFVAVAEGVVQRRLTVDVLLVNVGAPAQAQLGDALVPVLDSDVKKGVPDVVLEVDGHGIVRLVHGLLDVSVAIVPNESDQPREELRVLIRVLCLEGHLRKTRRVAHLEEGSVGDSRRVQDLLRFGVQRRYELNAERLPTGRPRIVADCQPVLRRRAGPDSAHGLHGREIGERRQVVHRLRRRVRLLDGRQEADGERRVNQTKSLVGAWNEQLLGCFAFGHIGFAEACGFVGLVGPLEDGASLVLGIHDDRSFLSQPLVLGHQVVVFGWRVGLVGRRRHLRDNAATTEDVRGLHPVLVLIALDLLHGVRFSSLVQCVQGEGHLLLGDDANGQTGGVRLRRLEVWRNRRGKLRLIFVCI